MSLREYRRKRDFEKTPEPGGKEVRSRSKLQFVIQKHAASHLHYDFRLEHDGVLKSWAVPKGPSLDPNVKCLAVRVEDHPLAYGKFEGTIPQGEYGGGTVIVWDRGTWQPEGDPEQGLLSGKLSFTLAGEKLQGEWSLVRMHGRETSGRENWLLFKRNDEAARPKADYNVLAEEPQSVLSGRTIEETTEVADRKRTASVKATRRGKPNSTGVKRKTKTTHAGKKTPRQKTAKRNASMIDESDLPGESVTILPRTFSPQLATLVREIPQGDNWLHELKFDGYRILAWITDEGVRLISRNGKDWTARFSSVAHALADLSLEGSILDGEVVALDERGLSSFQRLQNWLAKGSEAALAYYIFDAPYLRHHNLRRTPLSERKSALKESLENAGVTDRGIVRYSDFISGHGDIVLQQACRAGSEGIISKLATAPYDTGRTQTWVKTKCHRRQEFVIGGFTRPTGNRRGFGALLVGYFDEGKLIYSGRVGTGFTEASLNQLSERLRKLARPNSPFAQIPRGVSTTGVTWVDPKLVGEVEFTEWTEDGMLRHPSFQGLREDKPAQAVTRETPRRSTAKPTARSAAKRTSTPATGSKPTAKRAAVSDNTVAGVTISHPDRVVYPDIGLTKLDLAKYCADVSDWLLPHVAERPLSLVRCPQGASKACFYQKHGGDMMPPAVGSVTIKEKSGTDDYVMIDDLAGLISLVQMGVMEFHPWGSKSDDVERPDRLIFDLDPDPALGWDAVVEGTFAIREILEHCGLTSFARTSGGKGLHIVAPLGRRNDWEQVGDFAGAVARSLAERWPDRYTDNMRKVGRKGRIFVDYLRNRRGATAVASYSPRARPTAAVATPIGWNEVTSKLRPDQFTILNVRERLQKLKHDPWENFFSLRQSLTAHAIKEISGAISSTKHSVPARRRKATSSKRISRKTRASESKS